jgi:hypothetical protein
MDLVTERAMVVFAGLIVDENCGNVNVSGWVYKMLAVNSHQASVSIQTMKHTFGRLR